MQKLNQLILIKDNSSIKYDSFELVNAGTEVVKNGISIKNLDRYKELNKVIIINDYLDTHREDEDALSFIRDIFEINIYHINKNIESRFFQSSKRVVADLRSIDINILDEILVQNTIDMEEEQYKNKLRTIEAESIEIAKRLLKINSIDTYLDYSNNLRFILADYISVKNKNVINEAKLEANRDSIRELESTKEKLQNTLDEIKEIKENYKREYKKINNKYNELRIKYSRDKSTGYYDLREFTNSPKVVLFSTYTYLDGMFDYFSVLKRTIENTIGESVKVFVVAGDNFNNLSTLIPGNYSIYMDTVSSKNLYNDDFIVKYGSVDESMQVLLKNELNLNNLILVDLSNLNVEIDGRYANFNIVDCKRSMERLELDELDTICVDNKHMRWDFSSVEHISEEKIKEVVLGKQKSITEVVETIKYL